MIPGERAGRSVRAVQAGREPHDQEPRLRIAERRDWRAVVSRDACTRLVQKRGEPRATPAAGVEASAPPGGLSRAPT